MGPLKSKEFRPDQLIGCGIPARDG